MTAHSRIDPASDTNLAVAGPGPMSCLNCAAPLTQDYCGACGQGRHQHSRSIKELLIELAEHHFFLEGRMARSITALCGKPGVLTRAYIEGRRMRYLPPLRIYLLASLLFFLTLSLSGLVILQFSLVKVAVTEDGPMASSNKPQDTGGGTAPAVSRSEKDEQDAAMDAEIRAIFGLDSGTAVFPAVVFLRPPLNALETPETWQTELEKVHQKTLAGIGAGALYAMKHPAALNPLMEKWVPRLLVLLLPLIAVWLALLNWRRHLYFVDHLVFAMHIQAFAFVLLTVAVIVRPLIFGGWLLLGLIISTLVYLTLAQRRVYGGNWFLCGIKAGFTSFLYIVLLSIGMVGILLYSLDHLAA